jgi:hypothetical protein
MASGSVMIGSIRILLSLNLPCLSSYFPQMGHG